MDSFGLESSSGSRHARMHSPKASVIASCVRIRHASLLSRPLRQDRAPSWPRATVVAPRTLSGLGAEVNMGDGSTERGRVTPLELFFDLVVVFAITQVSTYLSHDPTWGGLLRGLLILGVLWWAWSAYAWLTNALDPEEGAIRLAVLAAIAAMLVLSLAVPGAFGADAVLFGVAYLIVRLLHLVLFAIAGRGDHGVRSAVTRLSTSLVAPMLLIVAGFLHGAAQLALWGVALAILYLGALIGHMRGFRVSPGHFVERFGLITIIALGESIVAIGVGAAGLVLDAGVLTAALLGVTVSACLWWAYFDWAVYVSQARLTALTGRPRAAYARDVYSYLHLPVVGGIVLFAFGLKATLAHVGDPLDIVPAFGLCGGVALYFAAHTAMRLRMGGGFGRGRPIAAAVLLALIPLARVVPALAALALVAVVCVALIAYEVFRHRESRAWIRSRRGGFTIEEAQSQNDDMSERRMRQRRSGAPVQDDSGDG
jgi:low temperature requirement protein LtrA